MLYDPKWEVQTKPDVFSLESLIAWLEKQPADGTYDWADPDTCLLGRWCASNGLWGDALAARSLKLGETDTFFHVALSAVREGCTFGAALERARCELRRQITEQV